MKKSLTAQWKDLKKALIVTADLVALYQVIVNARKIIYKRYHV